MLQTAQKGPISFLGHLFPFLYPFSHHLFLRLVYHHLTSPFSHYRLPFVFCSRTRSHDSVLFPHVAIVPSCI